LGAAFATFGRGLGRKFGRSELVALSRFFFALESLQLFVQRLALVSFSSGTVSGRSRRKSGGQEAAKGGKNEPKMMSQQLAEASYCAGYMIVSCSGPLDAVVCVACSHENERETVS